MVLVTRSGYLKVTTNVKQSGDEKPPVLSDQRVTARMKKSGQGSFKVNVNMIPDYTGSSYCNDPDYFFRFDTSSLDKFIVGESTTVVIEGGLAPYDWVITDNVDWAFSEAQTNDLDNVCNVCPTADVGDSATIQVTDACNTVITVVVTNCSRGVVDLSGVDDICVCPTTLAYDYDNSAETIAQSSSAAVSFTGGKANFSWTISGTGFTLDSATTTGRSNTVITDGTACGSGEITITDDCGETTTGYIRCTTGQWDACEVLGTVYDARREYACNTNDGGCFNYCLFGPGGAEIYKDPVITGRYKYLYSTWINDSFACRMECCIGCSPGPPTTTDCGKDGFQYLCCVEYISSTVLSRCTISPRGCGIMDVDIYAIWTAVQVCEWIC